MVGTSTINEPIGVVMSILAWIVLGAVAGIIADKLTADRLGLVAATVAGIGGALLGGWLGQILFDVRTLDTFFDLTTWVTAIISAVIVVSVLGAQTRDRNRGRLRGRSHGSSHRGRRSRFEY
jgi:uncharacterized membrane protein YeaQ/YmgE (transglycosylase-associated protein family)